MWVPHDVRDLVVDFVRCWSEKTEIGTGRFIHWLGVRASKFYDWRERYGRVNEHNGWVPRDFWLQPWEKQSIIRYYLDHPLEGYRRLGIPDDADRYSGHADHRFRDDGDHDSGMMPITRSGMIPIS